MSDDTNRPDSTSSASSADTKPAAGQESAPAPTPVKFNPLAPARRHKWSDIKTGRVFASKSEERRVTASMRQADSTSDGNDSSSSTDTPTPKAPTMSAEARRVLVNAPFTTLGITYSTGMPWSGERQVKASQLFQYVYVDGHLIAIPMPRRPDADTQANSMTHKRAVEEALKWDEDSYARPTGKREPKVWINVPGSPLSPYSKRKVDDE